MRNIHLLDINLRLFDGAAASASAGGEGSAGEGVVQADTSLPKAGSYKAPGSSRRGKTGEIKQVVYGKQGDASAQQTDGSDAGSDNGEGKANTLEARRRAYRELMDSPEYKDLYTEDIQRIINRRFKETKGLEESLSAQKPILDMLAQRYQVEDGDVKKLLKALEEDNTYWEAAAEEAGYTVEQFKAIKKLERENAEFQAKEQARLGREQARLGREQARQQLVKWQQEAAEVQKVYPTFDLRAELSDRHFQALLKNGIPMQMAYEVRHMGEIKQEAAKSAAQTAEQQVTAKIKSKAARPSENGTSSQSAVIVKNDVSKLTRKDRAEIARRVARGEKITF